MNFAAERRVRPANARGHDIEMAEHADELLPRAEFRIAGIPVKILCCKAHALRQHKRIVKRCLNLCAERRAGCGLSLHAWDGNDVLYGFDDCTLMRVKPGVHFRVHMHASLEKDSFAVTSIPSVDKDTQALKVDIQLLVARAFAMVHGIFACYNREKRIK